MQHHKVLLVEDNEDDIELTRLAFEDAGMANELVVARDGQQALDHLMGEGEYAGQEPCRPAIVLLDLKLPRIGGLDVLRRLRADERTRLLPVIVLTTSKEEQDVLQSYGYGANAYVRKPVDFGEFLDAVRKLGLFWLLVNEPPPRSGASTGK